MTQVFSIFERIGLGGGGKVRAVYHRMNALAEMPEFDPILLTLDHSLSQKLNFSELQAKGTIAPGVRLVTVPEACYSAALAASVHPYDGFPAFDQKDVRRQKTVYLQDGDVVMVDRPKQTPIGTITKRQVTQSEGSLVYTFLDGELTQKVRQNADSTTETTDFVKGLPIRWVKTDGRTFIIGKNLINGTICRMPRIYGQNVFEQIQWGQSVVFFDGITSAYLSPVTHAQRVLFLHADHRSPTGEVVPRSKFLIENFKGEAITTSTDVHKAQMLADVTPAADVHVIPHFCDITPTPDTPRKHFVTVSRLELTGKPIHECITAFCAIKDEYPDVDYLIYGLGVGQQQLEAQIADLGCGDRVHLEGYTTDPVAVFQGAVASIYPTMTEGFGLSILEALAAGCPVISYDVNYGPREMISPGINGELAPAGDIAAVADAMRTVLGQPEHYQRGTSRGLERYTRAAYMENYREFITSLKQPT
jgi:glycosyltransferase involved in cell wall biosynthesis